MYYIYIYLAILCGVLDSFQWLSFKGFFRDLQGSGIKSGQGLNHLVCKFWVSDRPGCHTHLRPGVLRLNPPLKSDRFAQVCTWKLMLWKLEFPTVLLVSFWSLAYIFTALAVLFQGVYHFFPTRTLTPFLLDRHPKIPKSNLQKSRSLVMNQRSGQTTQLFQTHTWHIPKKNTHFIHPAVFPTRSTNDDHGAPELLDDFFWGKKWQFFWAPDPAAHPVASLRACDSDISQVVVKKQMMMKKTRWNTLPTKKYMMFMYKLYIWIIYTV